MKCCDESNYEQLLICTCGSAPHGTVLSFENSLAKFTLQNTILSLLYGFEYVAISLFAQAYNNICHSCILLAMEKESHCACTIMRTCAYKVVLILLIFCLSFFMHNNIISLAGFIAIQHNNLIQFIGIRFWIQTPMHISNSNGQIITLSIYTHTIKNAFLCLLGIKLLKLVSLEYQ